MFKLLIFSCSSRRRTSYVLCSSCRVFRYPSNFYPLPYESFSMAGGARLWAGSAESRPLGESLKSTSWLFAFD